MENVTKRFGKVVANNAINLELREGEILSLLGENGSGKSTLLEAIAVAHGFNPEGGTRNYNFSTRDTHSELCDAITVAKGYRRERWGYFLRAESFYNLASEIDRMDREPSLGGRVIDSYGGVSLHRQSHGESFLSLIENRFGGTVCIFSTSRRPLFPP